MGGGGGRDSYDVKIADLYDKMQRSASETEVKQFQTELAGYLGSLLTGYNDRDTDAVNDHLKDISDCLAEDLESTLELRFGGSVAKHTYVDGLSDVDALVLIDNSELEGKTPAQVKSYFHNKLSAYFKDVEVTEGRLAITMKFKDAEIQILPALRDGDHYKIPNSEGEHWARIRPRKFSELLTKVNRDSGNKVVPTIKLAKAIIANLPERRQIKGYHAEALGIEAFKNYNGSSNLPEMLTHYFKESSRRVLSPLRDKTGQSIHVDEYLGAENSFERRLVSDSFSLAARRMEFASAQRILSDWQTLFAEL